MARPTRWSAATRVSPRAWSASKTTRSRSRRGIDAAVDGLVELIAAGDRDVEAAEILAGHEAHRERIVDLLVDRLGADPDAAVRSRLVQALAEIPGTAATSALQAFIGDADSMVARTAIVILDQRPGD